VKIWEAARATSAATTFFDPITIGDETFVDGATGANNPVNYLWSEAGDVWGDGEGLEEHRVMCLVSVGTGSPSLVPFGPDVASVAKALKAISTDTEVTASMFQKHHSKLFTNGNAFRFNVVAGLESVGLHEVAKWEDIAAATRAYIEEQETFIKLKRCALMLQERQCKVSPSSLHRARLNQHSYGCIRPGHHRSRPAVDRVSERSGKSYPKRRPSMAHPHIGLRSLAVAEANEFHPLLSACPRLPVGLGSCIGGSVVFQWLEGTQHVWITSRTIRFPQPVLPMPQGTVRWMWGYRQRGPALRVCQPCPCVSGVPGNLDGPRPF
jgi:hypothetical protein